MITFIIDSQSKKTPTLLGDRTYSDNNMAAENDSFNAVNGGAVSTELRMT